MLLLIATFAAVGWFRGQTTSATQTAAALAFAQAQATSGTGTALAETAAAAGDDDEDGLSNIQEASLGTSASNPDTDQDGLIDGVEVNQLSTDPKNKDSDGDTLPDGTEVDMGTSPINKDTDGDGVQDNVDDAPLERPTATSEPSATASPSATLTPTGTLEPSATPTPPGAVSMNCDGTYQHFFVADNGAAGKTAILERWNGNAWEKVWEYVGGDPNIKQIEDEVGLKPFGDCRQLLVLPVRHSGSGAFLDLEVFAWDGAAPISVLKVDASHGQWMKEEETIQVRRAVYLFNEPNCCPCNIEILNFRWVDTSFVQEDTELEPTFSGAPPPECTEPTAVPQPTRRFFDPRLLEQIPTLGPVFIDPDP
jgi:hypothetical protein